MTEIIDFHAHILPGADHGSGSVDTSVKQLELLKKNNITKVVATPHFYPNYNSVDHFLKIRENSVYKLTPEISKDMPTVFLGAEVLVCPGMDKMPDLELLCISGTNTILLEMPMSKWSDSLLETVYNISHMGFSVVIAHINRYNYDNANVLLAETGAVAQLNASCYLSRKGRKQAESWIKAGKIFALGTDLHGTNKAEIKCFLSFCKWIGDNAASIFEKTQILISGAKYIQ